ISLSQTICMFNPTWEEESDFDSAFDQAVDFAHTLLIRFVDSARGGLIAKLIVSLAIKQADDPRLIVLELFTRWNKTVHLFS
ncbi:metal-dependent hydrolase, partial [Pseudoalteromonas sp. S1609]|uniref:MYG1 family protein n=1 Tax=Pseudoalteromonas sp. S1609 TaxID=579505 RepID=UPI00110BC15E